MNNYTIATAFGVGGNVEGVVSFATITGTGVIFQSDGTDWWIINAY
jgi:hypothetical protein